jgi:hypothetical protein
MASSYFRPGCNPTMGLSVTWLLECLLMPRLPSNCGIVIDLVPRYHFANLQWLAVSLLGGSGWCRNEKQGLLESFFTPPLPDMSLQLNSHADLRTRRTWPGRYQFGAQFVLPGCCPHRLWPKSSHKSPRNIGIGRCFRTNRM